MAVAIIGCGQMGSRLLQGLLAVDADKVPPLDVTVVDPSADSLRLAESRAAEVPGAARHRVRCRGDVSDLPAELDLAIVASTSRHRLPALRALVERSRPRTVLLEKFLFDRREHYDEAGRLLAEVGATALVHCPRPTWPDYRRLATPGAAEIVVTGTGWAMASNAVHFLDLGRYFNARPTTRVEVAPDARTGGNKRAGYREVFGQLTGIDSAGNRIVLACEPAGKASLAVTVTTGDWRATIDEAAGTMVIVSHEGEESRPFAAVPASRNPGLLEDLLLGRPSALPSYADSAITHLALFEALAPLIGDDDGTLPVT